MSENQNTPFSKYHTALVLVIPLMLIRNFNLAVWNILKCLLVYIYVQLHATSTNKFSSLKNFYIICFFFKTSWSKVHVISFYILPVNTNLFL